ncbi:MAG: DUF2256 domain-containing protein [bacterium]
MCVGGGRFEESAEVPGIRAHHTIDSRVHGRPNPQPPLKDRFVPNHHLPTKPCAHCKREFAWRKKWERDWAHVKYCSKKCAAAAKAAGSPPNAR